MRKEVIIDLLNKMEADEVYVRIGDVCTPVHFVYIGSYEKEEDDFVKGRKIYLKEKDAKTKDVIVLEGERKN